MLPTHPHVGVVPADESAVAQLQLPEFPKEGDDKRSAPPIKPTPLAGRSESDTPSASPFILSEGLPPVRAKLVAKIKKGNYVDMAELLHDNMEWDCGRLRQINQRGAG